MIVAEGEVPEFLGQEFLTWLWYYGEKYNWTLSFDDGSQLFYGVDELLVLEPEGTGCSQKISGPFPVKAPEAQVGLQEGKKVSAMRLILVQGDREWSVTLRGSTFDFSSLKIMKPTTNDIDDRFAELSEDFEQAVQLFDKLYTTFLQIRLSQDWESELESIQNWVAEKEG